MRAVLWDMDGTLVDSEKLWDVSMEQLYERLGGVLSAEARAATVGGSAPMVMRMVYDDLGLDPNPAAMAESVEWLHARTGELFAAGLPWRPGARELLTALTADGVPMALVTNTRRDLTERALASIGRHFFTATVCADEVAAGKPAPDPYLRAAELLGVDAVDTLVVEDSVTGVASAEAAGCPILVIPNDVEVPGGPGRRHRPSLAGLTVADLRAIHGDIRGGVHDGALGADAG